jgi:hypothetical protein
MGSLDGAVYRALALVDSDQYRSPTSLRRDTDPNARPEWEEGAIGIDGGCAVVSVASRNGSHRE